MNYRNFTNNIHTEKCPRCDGEGKLYFKWNLDREEEQITKKEWEKLPDSSVGEIRLDIEKCPSCKGSGFIEVD